MWVEKGGGDRWKEGAFIEGESKDVKGFLRSSGEKGGLEPLW